MENADLQLGLALWLVPSDEDSRRLENLMSVRPKPAGPTATAAAVHLSETSYPRFTPHITLATLPSSSPITASALLSAAVELGQNETPDQPLQRLRANFESLNVGDHFFRSVFVGIKRTPELETLHASVHRALGMEPRTPAFPHMSLCYITDRDSKGGGERERFYEEIERGGRVERGGGEAQGDWVRLDCSSRREGGKDDADHDADWVSGFEIAEIVVARCEGPVETWMVVERVKLI